jgi:hypothetical protein
MIYEVLFFCARLTIRDIFFQKLSVCQGNRKVRKTMSGVVSEKPDLIPNLEGSANQSACRAGCRSSLELGGTPSGAEDEGREGLP